MPDNAQTIASVQSGAGWGGGVGPEDSEIPQIPALGKFTAWWG